MLINRYPMWKNILLLVVALIGFIYAAPNLYVPDPAVQISGSNAAIPVNEATAETIKKALQTNQVSYQKMEPQDQSLLLRFTSTDNQLKAKEVIQQALGNDYIVALNLAPSTPDWLRAINAMPMKLGLDLRGGLHFLYQVDVDSVVK